MKLKVGDKVRIVEDCRDVPTAAGATAEYVDAENVEDTDIEIPRFRLADGSFILGCECWWLPLAQALEAEREAKDGSQ